MTVILQMLDLRGKTGTLSPRLHQNQASTFLRYYMIHVQKETAPQLCGTQSDLSFTPDLHGIELSAVYFVPTPPKQVISWHKMMC